VSDLTEPPVAADEQTRIDLSKRTSRARRNARSAHTAAQVIEDFQHIASTAGEQAGRRQGRIFGVLGLVVAIVVSFLAGGLAVDNAAQLAAFRTQQDQRQTQIDDTLAKLADQNEILAARGQAPVEVPPPSADPTEAIAALVLSRVIAQLPPVPTADEVASAITPAVTANVLGPSQQQLTRAIADYYRAGGPAEAAIAAAVRREYAANPPRDGRDGENGQSPPCLSEPAQCRGADSTVPGPDGPMGPIGPAGPTCPDGTHLEEVTFGTLGATGLACVYDEPEEPVDEQGG
jgi:hypothetical protein